MEFVKVFYAIWEGEAWAMQLGGSVKSIDHVLDKNGNKCYKFTVTVENTDVSDLWG